MAKFSWPLQTVKLVGTYVDAIFSNVYELLTHNEPYQKMAFAHNPYGDGKTCQRIVDKLASLN